MIGVSRAEDGRPNERDPCPKQERTDERSAQNRLPCCRRQQAAAGNQPMLSVPKSCKERERSDAHEYNKGHRADRQGGARHAKPIARIGRRPGKCHQGKAGYELLQPEDSGRGFRQRNKTERAKAVLVGHRRLLRFFLNWRELLHLLRDGSTRFDQIR